MPALNMYPNNQCMRQNLADDNQFSSTTFTDSELVRIWLVCAYSKAL